MAREISDSSGGHVVGIITGTRRHLTLGYALAVGLLAATPSITEAADARELAHVIDAAIQKRLDQEKVPSSPPADDAEFLRRVYLDLTGLVPTQEKVVAFLDSADPDKRSRLIDELLASPEYGRHMAEIWENLLLPRSVDAPKRNTGALNRWLEQAFNSNKPWDQLAREVITATGVPGDNGAVLFLRPGSRVLKVTDATDVVCSVFLGVQIKCAQCHDHPFVNEWKKSDYWGVAKFFTKVTTQSGSGYSVTEGTKVSNKLKLPDHASDVPAKFLGGEQPKLDDAAPYRPVFAAWATAPQNPFFARANVNRFWAHFFARGLVNPVDEQHSDNPASHPELFQNLAEQYTASGFDVKHLIRAICNSQTYQRTSRPVPGNAEDQELLSHMPIKVLTPVQLYDSLTVVLLGTIPDRSGGRFASRNRSGAVDPQRGEFVRFLETEDEDVPTSYRRGIPHLLRLLNATPHFRTSADRLVAQQAQPGLSSARVVEKLYLTVLARRPGPEELQRMVAHVNKHDGDPQRAYSDILWVLLSSSEFTLNR
jgi:hypothetical protein